MRGKYNKQDCMKVTFREEALSELYETGSTKDRKYRSICRNKKLVAGYIKAVQELEDAIYMDEVI